MAEFDQTRFLQTDLPYRLNAIAWAVDALEFVRIHKEPRPIKIFVDEKLWIEGTHLALTNPSIEMGIVYSRVVLEFLGLSRAKKTGRLATRKSPREDGDIGIELLSVDSTTLSQLSLADVHACYPGDAADAESALLEVIIHAHKSVAHLTCGPAQNESTFDLLISGCKGVMALTERHVYRALGLKVPNYRIPTKTHLESRI
jgi:hypothetical protein